MEARLNNALLRRGIALKKLEVIYKIGQGDLVSADKVNEFLARCTDLDKLYDKFEDSHFEILSALTEVADLEVQEKIRLGFDNQFYAIKAVFNSMQHETSQRQIESSPVNTSSTSRPSALKLPKITLPCFDGNFKQWPSFYELYNTLVHEDESLPKIQKFQYLLTSLTKEPLALLKGFTVTEGNYLDAYNTLVSRYQNKRKIAFFHYEQLLNVKLRPDSTNSLQYVADIFAENLAVLNNLGFQTENWSFVLFHLLLTKLDKATRQRFELEFADKDIPSFQDLMEFIQKTCKAMQLCPANPPAAGKPEHSQRGSGSPKPIRKSDKSAYTFTTSYEGVSENLICPCCQVQGHNLHRCAVFKQKQPQDRYSWAKAHQCCLSCLSNLHYMKNCRSKFKCRQCGSGRHNSLLHFDKPGTNENSSGPKSKLSDQDLQNTTQSQARSSEAPQELVTTCTNVISSTTLLSTASCEIQDARGNFQRIRILLDSGSQANFISEHCMRKLGLRRSQFNTPIVGVNSMSTCTSRGRTQCVVKPIGKREPQITIEAIVLPKVCPNLPSRAFSIPNWQHLQNLPLSDNAFNQDKGIDLLIGAQHFAEILLDGRVLGQPGQASALNSIFGWILMGRVDLNTPQVQQPIHSCFVSFDSDLDKTLKSFWEIEEVPQKSLVAPEDENCENLFKTQHRRTEDGRYVVSLPFKILDPVFGNSYEIAKSRFRSLEYRLSKHPDLKRLYHDFMKDYIETKHMTQVSPTQPSDKMYYIPHHSVLNQNSCTTKLRVVFDASVKTASGSSLNSVLYTGPKLQQDLVKMIIKFRLHRIAFTADIKQMYRQILIEPKQRDFQRILWRFSPEDPIDEYQLNTVVYGVSSSPFLAIRTLQQLAEDEGQSSSCAAEILKTDFYMDDLLHGAPSLTHALSIKAELTELLSKGGFELRKWASNNVEFMNLIPIEHRKTPTENSLLVDSEQFIKILGLQWDPHLDVFSYSLNPIDQECTKRNMLSQLARIFDPLGFLSPVTFKAKCLLQELWLSGLDWDDQPSEAIETIWNRFTTELPLLSSLRLPRCIDTNEASSCELHGFADSSELGYCGVVYLRVVKENVVSTHLVCAKSKVAPLKKLSIPRLELQAAVLLSKLLKYVHDLLNNTLSIERVAAWSDSMVTLSWIRSSPHKWKTFVANRVALIQENLPPDSWRHVPSALNPADCASRGLFPSELKQHDLWWKGPAFLLKSHETWPVTSYSRKGDEPSERSPEEKISSCATILEINLLETLLDRNSSLSQCLRILSYCLRFVHNSRNRAEKQVGPLTTHELNQALIVLVRHIQQNSFSKELDNLKKNKPVSHQYKNLNLFIDPLGLLRAGGRLAHSNLQFDEKFPMLIPKEHLFTRRLIDYVHRKYLHSGVNTTHYLVQRQFWIISAKRVIRNILSKCVTCFKIKPISPQPPMASLPDYRVAQVKVFSHVGIDMGGPFHITLGKSRGCKSQKAYICVFVCLAVKAIHIELVSDLTSEAFLACLRRFISRRGRCDTIYSDNGSNFQGAFRQILKYLENSAAKETIRWKFNPPSAPHFGGIWESGIKSVKNHLLKIIGDQILTYEELYTILTQVEAVLNSRPLTPISQDPNDFASLTPGHFMFLEPLQGLPEPDITHLKLNTLSRWQLLQRLAQSFWKRWTTEYLHTLHVRSKWYNPSTPILQDTLVLIKDELTAPLKWKMGRVETVHPGPDNVSRVVTLRTPSGLLKRPVVKLCPLPLE